MLIVGRGKERICFAFLHYRRQYVNMLIVGRGKERMCRGYMKRLRRHQSMVILGLGAGAVSLGSHTDTVRRDAPTCLAMQGPGDQVVLALGHTVPGTDQCEGMEAVEVRLPDGALLERNRVFVTMVKNYSSINRRA